MNKWIVVAALAAQAVPAVAQEAAPMPAWEREAYLEACLIVKQTDPTLAAYQKVGTGAVTRGRATVAMFNPSDGRSGTLECSFATLTSEGAPAAERLAVTYADGGADELDVAAANLIIAAQMK